MLTILHIDERLVAIDKPAWAVVHRTRGAAGALVLVDALSQQLGARVFPAHRLDRQTSGVLVFARSAEVARELSDELRAGAWRKRYLGLCRDVLAEALVVDHPVPEGEHRREAVSAIEPLEPFCGRYTLVRARPRTGRRHQLRYHLKHLRHPLVGDTNYGQGPINRFFRQRFGLRRLFLHAERLAIPGAGADGGPLVIESPLPLELGEVIERLRAHEGPVA